MLEETPRPKAPYTQEELEAAKLSVYYGPFEERGLAEYAEQLGFKKERLVADLAGKNVLDIGAGLQLRFARELALEHIAPDSVVSFSPAFGDRTGAIAKERLGTDTATKLMVAGMGEILPFKDKSFDRVVFVEGPQYLRNSVRLMQMLKEVNRVLTDDGIAYMVPFYLPGKAAIPIHPLPPDVLKEELGESVTASWKYICLVDDRGIEYERFAMTLSKNLDDGLKK